MPKTLPCANSLKGAGHRRMEIARRCIYCDSDHLEHSPAIIMPFVAHRALGYAPVEITPSWGLRDVPTGQCQARCNTVHCRNCGGVFMDLRFGDFEMAALYENYRGPAYSNLRESYEPGYLLRNDELACLSHTGAVENFLASKLPEHPRILDWGGDDGRNTPFRLSASRCDIVDISGKATLPGTLSVAPTEALANDYDLVVLSHVLEHLPSPLSLLEAVASLVHRGARLYIEVPHEKLMIELASNDDSTAWRAKHHWHEHVNFFSKAALNALTTRAGLVVCQLEERSDSPESSVLCALCTSALNNENHF